MNHQQPLPADANAPVILLAEDDPVDREIIHRTLTRGRVPLHLHWVVDGQQAIDYLAGVGEYADRARFPLPDLVLLDLKMPRQTGFDVLAWRRTQASLAHVPVVVLTTLREDRDIARAFELGATSYLVKSAAPETLQDLIGAFVLPFRQPLRVLLIDDDPDARAMVESQLCREFPTMQITAVQSPEEIARMLDREPFDLVISDFNAPEWTGIENLRAVKVRDPERPVIIYTGSATQEDLIRALQAGLDDYVLNTSDRERARLPNAVRLAIGRAWQRRALRESEERYRTFFQNSMDAILLTAPDGSIFAANPAACKILGRTVEQICALGRGGLVDLSDPRLPVLLDERARTGKAFGELTMFRNDGSPFPVEVSSAVFQDQRGNPRTSMIIRDITERKRAEEAIKKQLAELQRWHAATMGRETRILDLKREVNELLRRLNEPIRYPSAEP